MARTIKLLHCSVTLLTLFLLWTHILAISYVPPKFIYHKSTKLKDVPDSFFYPETQGNNTFYRILEIHTEHEEGGHIYVGGRNSLTELSEGDLSLVKPMHVPSVKVESDFTCEQLQAGSDNSDYYCQNYVTFVQEVDDTTSILCGTNSLFPRCITFPTGDNTGNVNFTSLTRWNGVGLVASGPDQQTITYAKSSGDNLTVFSGAPTKRQYNFAFSRTLIGPGYVESDVVRTDTTESDWIEVASPGPSFVGRPIEFNGKMYFFFREEAVEAKNVEKVIYSRVGQVCMNDEGGESGALKDLWTTFLKARLSCATQGDIKMYFDNLQSIYQSKDYPTIVFGVFTTPSSGIPASALCAFDLNEIEALFNESPFKDQETGNSLWLNVPASSVPDPRPGSCSEKMPAENYNDLSSIQLMSSQVPNKANYTDPRPYSYAMDSDYPSLIFLAQRTLQIVVQERSMSGLPYDIFFFATDKGQILKSYLHQGTPRVVEEVLLTMEDTDVPEEINVLRISDDGRTLYASTNSRVYRLPTDNCGRFVSCDECVAGLDPACSWITDEGCKASQAGKQDLVYGDTSACPQALSTTVSQTMPATPATESTSEPDGQPDLTTDSGKASTPKQGQLQTGDGSELRGCYAWIVSAVILVIFCNVPVCAGLVVWCKRKECKKKTFSPSPMRRVRRNESQKPLKANQHSNSDESDHDESLPLTDTGNHSAPHKTTMVNYNEKNNGQTPTVGTPVKGSTMSASEV